jgi:glycosyltransferase involved in cell wall biosynthesis
VVADVGKGTAMSGTPRVSVVIPAFNHGRYVGEAVRSALDQSYPDLEVIVIDDGSTDDTREAIRGFGDRVRYFHQENRGLAAARNRGIGESRGDFVAFLDADDLWLPRKLERQLEVFDRHPSVRLVYAGVFHVDCEGRVLQEIQPRHRGTTVSQLLLDNVVIGSGTTAVVPRECLKELGGFDECFSVCEDWELWLRIARRYELDYVDAPLAKYRLHAGNAHKNQERMKAGRLALLDKFFADPTLPPGLRRVRRRAYGATYTHFGFFYYSSGEFDRARMNLTQAIRICPRLLLDARVAPYVVACILGPRFIRAAKRWKHRLAPRHTEGARP